MIQIKNPLKKPGQPKKEIKQKSKAKSPPKSEKPLTDLSILSSLSGIMKLRIGIGTIILFMTIAFGLAITSEFAFSVALIILSYFGLLVILIKLFLVKSV